MRVTAGEISDRAEFSSRHEGRSYPGSVRFITADFYDVELSEHFDVVSYWNGFGVGTDADQRRLLRRVTDEWLAPDGKALIDIANPFVWARWHGDRESRPARPYVGYRHSLEELTEFDPVGCSAIDTWWPAGVEEQAISQTIRCYSPADLVLLLNGTGMRLAGLQVGDRVIDADNPQQVRDHGLLTESHEYLAILEQDC